MADEPLAMPALYQQVAQRLRARIYAHELPPGAWIDEQRLAEEFGISRTPLREALKVLAAEGLVTLKPRRGCQVAEVSEEELDDIFPILALLEAQAVMLAMRRLDADALQRLTALHAELERHAGSLAADRFFEANQAFHAQLLTLAGNRWLMQLVEDTRRRLKLTRRTSLDRDGRIGQSLAEHRAIMEAIAAGNAARASVLMQEHILLGRAALAGLTAGEAAAAGK